MMNNERDSREQALLARHFPWQYCSAIPLRSLLSSMRLITNHKHLTTADLRFPMEMPTNKQDPTPNDPSQQQAPRQLRRTTMVG